MVKLVFASILLIGGLGSANAQADMTCADLLKANKQMDASVTPTMDADSAAMDRKVDDYCLKNPSAKVAEAMERALAD